MRTLQFTVLGRPQQRGSKVAMTIGKKGGGYLTRASGKPIVVCKDSNKKSEGYMQEVRLAAKLALPSDWKLLTGPIELSVVFYFARPKSHFRTGKHTGQLRDDAPVRHAQSPDLAKLVRCLEDSLKGIVWLDDKLVCRYRMIDRQWTTTYERAEITINELKSM